MEKERIIMIGKEKPEGIFSQTGFIAETEDKEIFYYSNIKRGRWRI